jgi:hypothetical protein
MEKFMVLVLFFVGIFLVLAAILALFRKTQPGEGNLEFMGVRLSGKGAPVFLLSGVFFSFSGYGWYHSLNQVHTLTNRVATVQQEKNEYADAAANLASQVVVETKARQVLQSQIPPVRVEELKQQQPSLFKEREMQISPRVLQDLQQRGIQVPH